MRHMTNHVLTKAILFNKAMIISLYLLNIQLSRVHRGQKETNDQHWLKSQAQNCHHLWKTLLFFFYLCFPLISLHMWIFSSLQCPHLGSWISFHFLLLCMSKLNIAALTIIYTFIAVLLVFSLFYIYLFHQSG